MSQGDTVREKNGVSEQSTVVVREITHPLSDWEIARGVFAVAISSLVGGIIGRVVGGWGNKSDEGRAGKIGGLVMAGISAVLAGSANFRPRREEITGVLPRAGTLEQPSQLSDTPIRAARITEVSNPHAITLPGNHQGVVRSGEPLHEHTQPSIV